MRDAQTARITTAPTSAAAAELLNRVILTQLQFELCVAVLSAAAEQPKVRVATHVVAEARHVEHAQR